MTENIAALARLLAQSARDLAPIVAIMALFQLAVVGEPPAELGIRALGLLALLVGLALLVRGMQMSLFPIGEGLVHVIARRGSLPLLLAFGFLLGFGSTVAEPALAAVVDKAMAAAMAQDSASGLLLRYATASGIGIGVALGLLRIVKGWSLLAVWGGAYTLVALVATLFGGPLIGVAFDAAAASTAVINLPLITALGVGLASVLGGRNPLVDGFGLVALATAMVMLAVLLFGLLWELS